jgi:phasin family protein
MVPAEALEPVPVATADETPAIEAVSKTAADTAEDVFAMGRTALDAFADSQNAMARGFEAIAVEAAAIMRSGMSAAADAGAAMLDARTFADAIDVQAGFARRSIDAALDGSARLSEITVKAVADASRPILSRFDETWRKVG